MDNKTEAHSPHTIYATVGEEQTYRIRDTHCFEEVAGVRVSAERKKRSESESLGLEHTVELGVTVHLRSLEDAITFRADMLRKIMDWCHERNTFGLLDTPSPFDAHGGPAE